MNTYEARIKSHGYLYAGFRNPIQCICGDAYAALMGIPPSEPEIPEKIGWDKANDYLLEQMTETDTYKDIADFCGCSDSVVRGRYARLVKEGRCQPRSTKRVKKVWYEQRHIDLLELLPVIGLANLSERFNRSERDVAALATSNGWRYNHRHGKHGYWYKRRTK